jgi:sporulation protein YlmC with PRC-barrel domain
MLKEILISGAISALAVAGAMAQSPSASPSAPTGAATDSASFIPAQSLDQWVFSKFKGTEVIGPDDAHIGNVNDILFERNGKIAGLVVGVGGFLGIGEKSVAIDMSAFQLVPADTGGTSNTIGSGGAGGPGGGVAAVTSGNDATAVKLKVSWTKDELKSAPDFQYYRAPPRPTTAPGGTPTGTAR